MKPVIAIVLLNALAAVLHSPLALSQSTNYPERPIRLVNPFPPGGSVDVTARLLAPDVSKLLGEQVVVENRSGASGIIGTGIVAKAPPDGYTLLINTTPLVTNTLMYPNVPYDVLKDFEAISMIAAAPSFLGVHPSVPVHSVRELIALSKSKPGLLNYGSAGIGTNPHIAGELFNYLAKTNIGAIHYKGGGPALTAEISGEVSIGFSSVAGAVGFVKSGQLRALAVTSLKPVAALPGVPTMDASGLPGYEFVAWFALVAPKGTPHAIIVKLNESVRKALSKPETVARLQKDALEVIGSTPGQLASKLESELKKWATVIEERGMRTR